MRIAIIIVCLSLLAGCQKVQPKARGGMASFGGNLAEPTSLMQPESPDQNSKQKIVFEQVEKTASPKESVITKVEELPDGSKVTTITQVPAGTVTTKTTKQNVEQEVSGSWKDDAATIAAKLGSFKPVQYFGMLLIVASLAMFHPLVRAAIGGGKEIQWGAAAVGAILIFLPTFIVGQEKLIIIAAVVLLGGAYLLTRLSYYKGKSDVKND